MLFLLISDIDKNAKSWEKWITPNGNVLTSNFVKELKKHGEVLIPQPNWVNFRIFDRLDNNSKGKTDYDINNIYFDIKDLEFENYSKWIKTQIPAKYKNSKKITIIGLSQGCHNAKFLANDIKKWVKKLYILGDRLMSKKNYEKLWKPINCKDRLYKKYGSEWKRYLIENANNEIIKKMIDRKDIPGLNNLVKGKIRSQYNKIKNLEVPSVIYSYITTDTEKIKENDKLIKNSDVKILYYYVSDDSPYLIYSKYMGDILYSICQK